MNEAQLAANQAAGAGKKPMDRYLRYLLLCLPFTVLLLLPMVVDWMLPGHVMHMAANAAERSIAPGGWLGGFVNRLMQPWIQLLLCLPVYLVGMNFFGRSAMNSIVNRMPNMNVLIVIGSTAAFLYSLAGTLSDLGPAYQFYETTASIITLIFFGNYLEEFSIRATQKALNSLVRSQKQMANMIAFDDSRHELVFPVENTVLKPGDLILIKSGEQVPADCKILWGRGQCRRGDRHGGKPADRTPGQRRASNT